MEIMTEHTPRLAPYDPGNIVMELEMRRKQVDELRAACEKAMEWAASYPLSGAFGVMDKGAADEVYKACELALAHSQP